MKKQITILMLTLLGVGALGAGFGVSTSNAQPAEPAAAEGHTHDFVSNGKHTCSCGAIRLEAEYGERYGKLGVGIRRGNSSFGHETSGYGFVGEWDKSEVSNPSLTWKLYSSVAQTVNYVNAWVSNCTNISSGASAYRLEVNGVTYTTGSSLVPLSGGNYYNWENLTFEQVSLNAGENTVKLISVNGLGVNVDCIDFNSSVAGALSCRYSTRLEAENAYIKGTPFGAETISSYTPVKQTAFHNNGDYSHTHDSAGASVGNWYCHDTSLRAYFYLTKNTKVKLALGVTFHDVTDLDLRNRVWGTGIDSYSLSTNLEWAGDGGVTVDSTWHDWLYLYCKTEFEVTAGLHYVHIEANNNHNLNIDAIDITALDQSAVIFEGESANELVGFVNDNMHMTDYTENKGWCKDAEHHYYATAKTAFNALSSGARALITDEVFAAPYARLQAWATANNDVFNTANALVSNDTVATGVDTTTIIVLSMICILSTAAITLIVVKKKKRSVK